MKDFIAIWEDIYETGEKVVDDQHKKLFELLNNFASAYFLKKEKLVIDETLFQLENYTKYHFDAEEKVLHKENKEFPTKHHLDMHKEFIDKLHELKFDYVSDDKIISSELLDYLKNWLVEHILGVDKKEFSQINGY
ncbi:MAG: hypothetical protein DRJ10_17825 [Bacteroidetes bacterium]|nr:MAG: hypothetical protein DRJ10_17825 [Bacteroidota bacterium]